MRTTHKESSEAIYELRRIIKRILPTQPDIVISKLALSILNYPEKVNKNYQALLNIEKSYGSPTPENQQMLKYFNTMIDKGYSIFQVIILASAPVLSEDNTRPRERLLESWNAEKGFEPEKFNMNEDLGRIGTVGGTLLALGGMYVVFTSLAASAVMNEPSLADKANTVAQYAFGLTQDIYEFIENPKTPKFLNLLITSAGIALGFKGLDELTKKAKKVALLESIYPRLKDNEKQKYKKLVEDIPLQLHNLLTHLSFEEKILFLDSNDSDRKIILTKNPPSIEQRYMAGITAQNLRFKIQEKMAIAATPWRYEGKFHNNGLSLKQAISSMRNKSNNPGSNPLKY